MLKIKTFPSKGQLTVVIEMGFTKIVSRSVLGTREEPSNAERQQKEKRKEKKRGYNILKILIAWGCKKTQVIYSPFRKEEEREGNSRCL